MNLKLLLAAIMSLILGTSALSAPAVSDVPDADQSDVEPWDTFDQAFTTPGSPDAGSHVDDVTATIRYTNGNPVPFSHVWVDVSGCPGLCTDPSMDGLSGSTDVNGVVVLNPRVGGCADCEVLVFADGVRIRSYEKIRSTDWDGASADGALSGADFSFFAGALKETQDSCADYDNDGHVSGLDFSFFATSFKLGDANSGGCE